MLKGRIEFENSQPNQPQSIVYNSLDTMIEVCDKINTKEEWNMYSLEDSIKILERMFSEKITETNLKSLLKTKNKKQMNGIIKDRHKRKLILV